MQTHLAPLTRKRLRPGSFKFLLIGLLGPGKALNSTSSFTNLSTPPGFPACHPTISHTHEKPSYFFTYRGSQEGGSLPLAPTGPADHDLLWGYWQQTWRALSHRARREKCSFWFVWTATSLGCVCSLLEKQHPKWYRQHSPQISSPAGESPATSCPLYR